MPRVPVGGPPTRPGQSTQPAPAAPAQNAVLLGVDADLAQIQAISDYTQDKAEIASDQLAVEAAQQEVATAQAAVVQANLTEQAAERDVATASSRLAALALAAYTGAAYSAPFAGPAQARALATVSSPDGLSGSLATDARELLSVVADHEEKSLEGTHEALEKAQQGVKAAESGLRQAQAVLSGAQEQLQAAQQALVAASETATNPALAAASVETAASAGPSGGASLAGATVPELSVLGPSTLNAAELAGWFASTGHKADITVPMSQLASDYITAGQQNGVRADVAFAQSVVETGYFSFPSYGQLTPKDNNFAGIGACDSCAHGWSFPNAMEGVTAQMELLHAYASPKPVPTPLVGPVGVGGCCRTCMALAGKWATSPTYGYEIMGIYEQMLQWAIPGRLAAAGLGPSSPGKPSVAASQMPEPAFQAAPAPLLAKLPGS